MLCHYRTSPQKFSVEVWQNNLDCILRKETLTGQITVLAASGVTDWFSGMALGTDMRFAYIEVS